MKRLLTVAALVLMGLSASGCASSQVRTYETTKEMVTVHATIVAIGSTSYISQTKLVLQFQLDEQLNGKRELQTVVTVPHEDHFYVGQKVRIRCEMTQKVLSIAPYKEF